MIEKRPDCRFESAVRFWRESLSERMCRRSSLLRLPLAFARSAVKRLTSPCNTSMTHSQTRSTIVSILALISPVDFPLHFVSFPFLRCGVASGIESTNNETNDANVKLSVCSCASAALLLCSNSSAPNGKWTPT